MGRCGGRAFSRLQPRAHTCRTVSLHPRTCLDNPSTPLHAHKHACSQQHAVRPTMDSPSQAPAHPTNHLRAPPIPRCVRAGAPQCVPAGPPPHRCRLSWRWAAGRKQCVRGGSSKSVCQHKESTLVGGLGSRLMLTTTHNSHTLLQHPPLLSCHHCRRRHLPAGPAALRCVQGAPAGPPPRPPGCPAAPDSGRGRERGQVGRQPGRHRAEAAGVELWHKASMKWRVNSSPHRLCPATHRLGRVASVSC